MRYLYLIVLAVFLPLSALAQPVGEIIVQGNQRIEIETIKSYLDIKEGEQFDQKKLNASVKKLFATGLFSDLSVKKNNGDIIITVAENPIINKVSFEGNKRINSDNLNSEISLQSREVYTKSKLQNDVKRIRDAYRRGGRFSVDVDPKVVQLDQNRIDLIFEIQEGKKATVKKIIFVGNEKFPDDKLEKTINTKESRWYSFYSGNDTYDPDRVSFDKELLRKFYISKGYADFRVTSVAAEITKDKKSFILTFNLEEGEKYKFGKIDIKNSIPDLEVDELRGQVDSIEGEVFNANLIDSSVEKLTNHLNDIGFAFVEINPVYQRDTQNNLMGLVYKIDEGPKVYIDRINVSGNVRTLDKVIRREFRISEGDPFNAAKIRRSKQRINNLGFFDKVEVNSRPAEESDKADIDVQVSEKSTGELSFGAGFSTTEGALGNVSVRERNLLGRGQDLKVAFQRSSRGNQIDLGFTEPYFLGKDVSAGFDIFDISRDNEDESSFDSETTGGTLRASYSLTEHLRHAVRYSYKTVNVTDIQDGASIFVTQQAGENATSLVGHTLTYDKRDNRFDPTDGYFLSFSQDFAGVGGDSKFIKNELRSGYYKTVYREDFIFNASLKGGYMEGLNGKSVRINERFFIGGNTIRGFRDAGIGPRDRSSRDALGGNIYYAASTGLTFPLGLPDELGFRGEAFVDAGSLFDVDDSGVDVLDEASVRASVGIGISWRSPLGPIRIDLAEPFLSESFDRTQSLRFNFGTRF